MRVDLGDAVRAAGVEGRRLPLRHLARAAEHLARARLVDARLGGDQPHGLQQPRHPDGVELGGEHGLRPRRRHEGLGGEIVDLVRPHVAQEVDERELVEQIRLAQLETGADVGDALEVLGARAPHHADDTIALLEQQLGEIRPVLARDPGDDGGRHRPQLRP